MAENKVEILVRANVEGEKDVSKLGHTVESLAPAGKSAAAGANAAASGFANLGQTALTLNQAKELITSLVQTLGGVPAEVLKTADAYNNLAARVQLVTGAGPAFEAAFDGIAQVAQRTSSNLESTGLLFTKLAEAGKSMGIGQTEALKLTETVNQAIQLSGASAQASDAAIVQLVQGLQGGVLRGDEFNSVMEQSPRLAKALADGLNVGTGELRKMAEAGHLTADTVIKALQGQSDTVASEFAKLPPTVGRALENLSTSWTLYVGETDKATGASKAAATVISALAANLNTIAGYLIDAGQAAAAFAALKLAQHFIGIATAATSSATAVAANTAAITEAGTASTAAATTVGRFASILRGLKTFSLIGIVTNFHDIGTAIGEGAAKLMGYKDRTNELAAAEKVASEIAADNAAMRKRMADATQAAIDKQFELGKSAVASIAEFDKLTKAGDTAAEAIKKIGKDFDLSSIPGIRDASAVLDKLAADGKISATEFQTAWSDALKGADLATFETNARAAFAGTARETERLTQVIDATLREAVKRAGLDFALISGGMSKASISAINDTDAIINGLGRLQTMGADTARALTASIGKGIDTADSQKAIDAVRAQIEAVRKALGDKVADGLLDQATEKANKLSDALDKATPGINSIYEAMQKLGVKSQESLDTIANTSRAAFQVMKDSGVATTRELSDGFKKYATDAIAANDGVASASIKAQAAMYGLQITADETGKSIVSAMTSGQKDSEKIAKSLEEVQSAIGSVDKASQGLTGTLSAETKEKIAGAQANLDSAQARYEDAKASGDEKGAAEALVEVKKAELELAKVMAEAKREEAKAARDVADAKKREAQEAAATAQAIAEEISKAKEVTAEMQKQLDTAKVNAVAKAGQAKEAYAHADALDAEAKGLERGVATAERALTTAENAYNRVAKSAREASSAIGGTTKALTNQERQMQETEAHMEQLIRNLADGTNLSYDLADATAFASQNVGYLGEEKLSGLRSAIEDARQRMESLRKEAQDTLNSLQDELDQLTSNFDEIENRKYQAQKDDLSAKLKQAIDAKDSESIVQYQKALDTLNKIHDLRLADAQKKEQQAVADAKDAAVKEYRTRRGKGYDQVDTSRTGLRDYRSVAEVDAAISAAKLEDLRANNGDKSTSASATSNKTYTVNVTINGQSTAVNVASEADAQALISALKRASLTA